MSTTPRVRFAPAPSGWLHVGSVRTALFNWLHARHHGGTFVFRIEDTDQSRATTESMDSMLDAMTWLGLDWDEGVRVGGPYGPYRQSERAPLHLAVARRLEAAGHLYRDARTAEELDGWRAAQREAGQPPIVKRSTTPVEDDGRPAVLRLALPEHGSITVDDLVRGQVTWQWAHESDPVVVRSSGDATYPLANTVDDVAQGITLVCRGEDLLSVTPRQAFLYELLLEDGLIDDALEEVGMPARDASWRSPGAFAHLSMIVGPDRKKLSKRHGSVAIQQFARQGYLPETLVNYIALLGWAPPDGRERLTVDELIQAFDLDNVGRAAAAFDVDKLTAFNGERIRELDEDELAERLLPYLDGTLPSVHDDGQEVDDATPLLERPVGDADRRTIRGLVPLVQERMQRLGEIRTYAPPFLVSDLEIDEDAAAKVFRKAGAREAVVQARSVLADVDWTVEAIEAALRGLAERLQMGFGKVAQPIRVAVTGSNVSPPLFESIQLLPRERVLARLDAAVSVVETHQPAN